jgi:uncharacterized OsmC-like protein
MSDDKSGATDSESNGRFSIAMDCIHDYEFRVAFDREQLQELVMDEPPPLGGDKGPSASRLLAAAVGNCLSASWIFCARKARVDVQGVHTEVTVQFERTQRGRRRIAKIQVAIEPQFAQEDADRARRCLDLFEDYCVVTESVRQGIDVSVVVKE